MEQVIAESDHNNIKGAIKAFNDYVNCKNYYSSEKEDLQSRLNQVKSSIAGAKEHVGQFSITETAIDMAESIAKMSTMDKLFIHLISAPNPAYAKQYKVIDDDGKELFKGSFIACTDFMYAPAQEEILQEIHIVPVEESKEKDNE